MNPLSPLRRISWPLFALCLFGIVLGLKWATFFRYGSAMPDWDQWDAEAVKLLAPWFEHDRFLAQLFEPHNEHRVVMTKLQNLALALASGQWDARLEAATNAVLHSVIAVAFWCVAAGWLWQAAPVAGEESAGDPRKPARALNATRVFLAGVLFVLVVAIFGLPAAWQNVLGGFHSQQYWLLGLSFAAIVALPFAQTWSGAWWAAALAAVLALLTMGSGLLAPAAVLGMVGWRIWRRDTTLRATWPTLVLAAVLVGVGWATRYDAPQHAPLKAKTVHDFVFSLLRSLEWPFTEKDWAGPLLWIPWALMLWPACRRGATRAALTIAALGGWVLLQLLATAYARGAGADYPASRYMDTLVFGTAVNAAALGWWIAQPRLHGAVRLALGLGGLAWLACVAAGVKTLVVDNYNGDLPRARAYYDNAERHMLGYLSTDDPAHFAFPDIPYPSAEALIDRLRHRCLRKRMPTEVRPSLPLVPATGKGNAAAPENGFLANRASELTLDQAPRNGLRPPTPALATRPTWGSFNERGARHTGRWVSAPLTATLGGWLKFEIAGDLGSVDATLLSLVLRDATTGAELARVRPDKYAGNSWRSAYVRAPQGAFVVEARDDSEACWFAFSAPVEMSRLSHAAWRTTKHGLLIAEVSGAVALALAGGIVLLQTWERKRRDAARP